MYIYLNKQINLPNAMCTESWLFGISNAVTLAVQTELHTECESLIDAFGNRIRFDAKMQNK